MKLYNCVQFFVLGRHTWNHNCVQTNNYRFKNENIAMERWKYNYDYKTFINEPNVGIKWHHKTLKRWMCSWCNGYRRRKWTRWQEFKSWSRLIAFHIALIPLGKVWIQLFSLQLWVNRRTAMGSSALVRQLV